MRTVHICIETIMMLNKFYSVLTLLAIQFVVYMECCQFAELIRKVRCGTLFLCKICDLEVSRDLGSYKKDIV